MELVQMLFGQPLAMCQKNQHHPLYQCYQAYLRGASLGLSCLSSILLNSIQSKVLSFADATKCHQQILTLTNSVQLQSDLDTLYNWSVVNNLSFNLNKFVHISFKHKHLATYHINDVLISPNGSHRDLHYQHILAKAYKTLGLIRHTLKTYGSIQTKKVLYMSLICFKLL